MNDGQGPDGIGQDLTGGWYDAGGEEEIASSDMCEEGVACDDVMCDLAC